MIKGELRRWAMRKIGYLCKRMPGIEDDMAQELEIVFIEISQNRHRVRGMGAQRYVSQRISEAYRQLKSDGVSLFTPLGNDGTGELIDVVKPREIPRIKEKRRLKYATDRKTRFLHKCIRQHRCSHCSRSLHDRSKRDCLLCRVKSARRCWVRRRLKATQPRRKTSIGILFDYALDCHLQRQDSNPTLPETKPCHRCSSTRCRKYGKTTAGTQRFRCNACGASSVAETKRYSREEIRIGLIGMGVIRQ